MQLGGPEWDASPEAAAEEVLGEDELAPALRHAIAALEHLNRHTEQDFLTIGGKLSEFVDAVEVISSGLKTLVDWEHAPGAP